jgi:hypothetical protein
MHQFTSYKPEWNRIKFMEVSFDPDISNYISLKYINSFWLHLVPGDSLSEVFAGCLQVSGKPLSPLQSDKIDKISLQITGDPSLWRNAEQMMKGMIANVVAEVAVRYFCDGRASRCEQMPQGDEIMKSGSDFRCRSLFMTDRATICILIAYMTKYIVQELP